MSEDRHIQPYQKFPYLRPEGNAIETLYGNRQRRVLNAGAFYNVPVGISAISTRSTPASLPAGSINNGLQITGLLKENEILIPIHLYIGAGAGFITSPLNPATLINFLSASATLDSTYDFLDVYPLQSFSMTGFNGLGFFGEIPMAPIRWDDYSGYNVNLNGGNGGIIINPIISDNVAIDVVVNVENTSGLARTIILSAGLLYDIMTLEEYQYGRT